MSEPDVFPYEAADVAMQAIKDGVARITMTWQEAYEQAKADIKHSRGMTDLLMEKGYIKEMPDSDLQDAFDWACQQVSK
jgi:malate dehydrogenase (oxaloacetate-decarboxylating)